jgi:sialic acid synthase SpsE
MFIIAEVGMNHYDHAKINNLTILESAKLFSKIAKENGADAVKFQTYTAEKLVSKLSPAYWDLTKEPTTSQYELFKKFKPLTPNEWQELSEYCKSINIEFMTTVFDLDSVDIIKNLQKIWKISSSDITNFPLIDKISKQGGEILLSTGASDINDIRNAIDLISKNNKNIVIMHCILNYPTKNENANLNMITDIKNNFPDYKIGYSDHTEPDKNMLITTCANLLGAEYIEKHFTLDKTIPGNDHYHSMDPSDLKILSENKILLNQILGIKNKICIPTEIISKNNARRSIYTKVNLNKNDIITENNIICKRPYEGGICATKFNDIIGKRILININEDYQIKSTDLN